MPASPSSVLTRGLGSWGDVNLLVTHGFGVAAVQLVPPYLAVVSDTPKFLAVQTDTPKFTAIQTDRPKFTAIQTDRVEGS